MPRYHVTGIVTGSKYLGVFEAATEQEAIDKALEAEGGSINLCHQCNDECEDGCVGEATASEADDDE